MDEVLEFIDLIKKTFGKYPDTSGGCYKFHLILRTVFAEGMGYYNEDHIITKIGDLYYDIYGVYPGVDKGYLPIDGVEYSYEDMDSIFKEYI